MKIVIIRALLPYIMTLTTILTVNDYTRLPELLNVSSNRPSRNLQNPEPILIDASTPDICISQHTDRVFLPS